VNNDRLFQHLSAQITPNFNYDPGSGEYYPAPIKSWNIITPKIWIEEKPMQEKNEVRVKVPAGTRFTEIVIEVEGSQKEFAIVDVSMSYSQEFLGGERKPIRTFKVIERENEGLRLERAMEEAKKKAVEAREKYHAFRREVEAAQGEENRARSALENYRRKMYGTTANPFA